MVCQRSEGGKSIAGRRMWCVLTTNALLCYSSLSAHSPTAVFLIEPGTTREVLDARRLAMPCRHASQLKPGMHVLCSEKQAVVVEGSSLATSAGGRGGGENARLSERQRPPSQRESAIGAGDELPILVRVGNARAQPRLIADLKILTTKVRSLRLFHPPFGVVHAPPNHTRSVNCFLSHSALFFFRPLLSVASHYNEARVRVDAPRARKLGRRRRRCRTTMDSRLRRPRRSAEVVRCGGRDGRCGRLRRHARAACGVRGRRGWLLCSLVITFRIILRPAVCSQRGEAYF